MCPFVENSSTVTTAERINKLEVGKKIIEQKILNLENMCDGKWLKNYLLSISKGTAWSAGI